MAGAAFSSWPPLPSTRPGPAALGLGPAGRGDDMRYLPRPLSPAAPGRQPPGGTRPGRRGTHGRGAVTVRLDKQVAVVTGSDSGIGQAIAIEFAREGADVAVTYHTDEDGARETERLVLDAGGRAIGLRVDVTSEEQVEGLFAETLRRLGTPSILVNNAGMGGPGDEVADLPTQAWRRVIETNLFGPFYGCRRFVALRREAG